MKKLLFVALVLLLATAVWADNGWRNSYYGDGLGYGTNESGRIVVFAKMMGVRWEIDHTSWAPGDTVEVTEGEFEQVVMPREFYYTKGVSGETDELKFHIENTGGATIDMALYFEDPSVWDEHTPDARDWMPYTSSLVSAGYYVPNQDTVLFAAIFTDTTTSYGAGYPFSDEYDIMYNTGTGEWTDEADGENVLRDSLADCEANLTAGGGTYTPVTAANKYWNADAQGLKLVAEYNHDETGNGDIDDEDEAYLWLMMLTPVSAGDFNLHTFHLWLSAEIWDTDLLAPTP